MWAGPHDPCPGKVKKYVISFGAPQHLKSSHVLFSFLSSFTVTTIDSHVEFCVGDMMKEVSRVDRKEEAAAQLTHHPTLPYGEKAAGPDSSR